ncbi:uncharacterized protein LOC103314182 isoform X2 [Tribolium castaneum]|uniref:uncharacterized protein LOC103314182 isoform X2 n=1 Tax=Tribolium castaneum TaxID=7070 RepID=UPI00046BF5D3|nr:PREDICTED: uncharacterized protein LOC103314182 isoform X2 [Tribolium castaneum]|eukprot:XP_008197612.1 PREDICTED: uncharacterized protein LOC103314182 isoform X2 [Tribolium castaneum]
MMSKPDLKSVIELKKEVARMEEVANFLRIENFEYALKINRLENIITSIQAVTKDHPAKLVELSDGLLKIIHTCNEVNPSTAPAPETKETTPKDQSQISVKVTPASPSTSRPSKAHVVKPHMVEDSTLRGTTAASTSSQTIETENNSTREFHSGSVSHLENVSQASTSRSPTHSTVLSGTFQEVKIYLNQVSQESINGETRKSVSPRRPSASPRRLLRRHRSSGLLSSVTTRRHNRK